MQRNGLVPKNSFYIPEIEHAACGVGFVTDIGGIQCPKTLQSISRTMVNLNHRGAADTDAQSGCRRVQSPDIPTKLFAREIERPGSNMSSSTVSTGTNHGTRQDQT